MKIGMRRRIGRPRWGRFQAASNALMNTANRTACNRHTHDDEQVLVDLRALPLAICWLQEAREPPPLLGRRGAAGQPYAGAAATSSIAWEAENPSMPRTRSSSARASSR